MSRTAMDSELKRKESFYVKQLSKTLSCERILLLNKMSGFSGLAESNTLSIKLGWTFKFESYYSIDVLVFDSMSRDVTADYIFSLGNLTSNPGSPSTVSVIYIARRDPETQGKIYVYCWAYKSDAEPKKVPSQAELILPTTEANKLAGLFGSFNAEKLLFDAGFTLPEEE